MDQLKSLPVHAVSGGEDAVWSHEGTGTDWLGPDVVQDHDHPWDLTEGYLVGFQLSVVRYLVGKKNNVVKTRSSRDDKKKKVYESAVVISIDWYDMM